MSFINEQKKYDILTKELSLMIQMGKQLPEQVFKPNFSIFFFSYFDQLFSKSFFNKLKKFTSLEIEDNFLLYVIDPSPKTYYWKHWKFYPIIEFSSKSTDDVYLELITKHPKSSPADAIAYNSNIILFFSLTAKWIIYADRDNEMCIIAFSNRETAENFAKVFGENNLFNVEKSVENLMTDYFVETQKIFINTLINNYRNVYYTN